MPKRFDDPWSQAEDDEEHQEESRTERKTARTSSSSAARSLEAQKAAIVATAKDSQKAGKYIRRTFTWTPGQIAMIRRASREMRLSDNKTVKVLLDLGIQAYLEGKRPEFNEERVTDPVYESWS
jgi:hypothetical protein